MFGEEKIEMGERGFQGIHLEVRDKVAKHFSDMMDFLRDELMRESF